MKKFKYLTYFTSFVLIACFALFAFVAARESGSIAEIAASNENFHNEAIFEYMKDTYREGMIYDCNGNELLVKASNPNEESLLVEPYAYSWLIGSDNPLYAQRGGIRNIYRYQLYDGSNDPYGSNIHLTIDHNLQMQAFKQLTSISHDGSIIILDNKSGAIKALASISPISYNGNEPEIFSKAVNQSEGGLNMRGIYEQDPPASTFKLITLTCAIEEGLDLDAYYYDQGYYTYQEGRRIYNYGGVAYGYVNAQQALNKSINSYFVNLAQEIGYEKLNDMYKRLLFNERIELDFSNNKLRSHVDTLIDDDVAIGNHAIGQGSIQIAPLQLASIIASYGNEGQMMHPYMIDSVGDNQISNREVLSQITSKEVVDKVNEYAHQSAISYGFDENQYGWVCAKTGTAEFQAERCHSYLALYNDDYTILISCNDINSSVELFDIMKPLVQEINN